jgi:spore maturation protein CgeB
MSNKLLIDKTILFLYPTDQRNSIFSKYKYTAVNGSYDIEQNWDIPLSNIFKNVIKYDYLKNLIKYGTNYLQNEIIGIVKNDRPEYVIIPMSMYEIRRSTINTIRQLGSRVILYFFDDASRFDNYGKWWIGYFDYVLTEDLNAKIKYKELNVNAINIVCGSNEKIYQKIETEKKKHSVSFVGRKFSNRGDYINEILQNDISVDVFGEGWNNFISIKEMIRVFNSSKINLNFTSTYNDFEIKQLKARIFEITMCGGFMLTEYVTGLEEYFKIGKEIDCFQTKEEAIQKIKYYLKNNDIRNEIAIAGWKRSHKDHSWKKRLSEIFYIIEQDSCVDQSSFSNKLSKKVLLPKSIKKLPSDYHYNWAVARLLEGQKKLFKEEIYLSLSYNPFHVKILVLFVLSHLSPFLKPKIIISLNRQIINFSKYLMYVVKLLFELFKSQINRPVNAIINFFKKI